MQSRQFGLVGISLEFTVMQVSRRISFLVLVGRKSNFGRHQQ